METTNDRKRAIQRRFGLAEDAIFGPNTLTKVEHALDENIRLKAFEQFVVENNPDVIGQYEKVIGKVPEPSDARSLFGDSVNWAPPKEKGSLTTSIVGMEQISAFEISSESYYNSRLKSPTWPGWSSGVTVGIGYDLGHTPKSRIRRDWQGRISDESLNALLSVQGVKGKDSKYLATRLKARGIKIPIEVAKQVFYERTLPTFAGLCRSVYPGVEELPPDAQSMMLSLVFNRGSSMKNTDRRREMRELRKAVADKDLLQMAILFRSMRRLWDANSGLYPRRTKEADMIAKSNRKYKLSELVVV